MEYIHLVSILSTRFCFRAQIQGSSSIAERPGAPIRHSWCLSSYSSCPRRPWELQCLYREAGESGPRLSKKQEKKTEKAMLYSSISQPKVFWELANYQNFLLRTGKII